MADPALLFFNPSVSSKAYWWSESLEVCENADFRPSLRLTQSEAWKGVGVWGNLYFYKATEMILMNQTNLEIAGLDDSITP